MELLHEIVRCPNIQQCFTYSQSSHPWIEDGTHSLLLKRIMANNSHQQL